MKLFDPGNVVGVFRGFSDSGMEFHADLVLPYREELQSIPMHGQFVLVQLTREDEAVLGRITSVAAEGRLVSPIGEDYAIRAVRDDRPIPDELRDQYLKYRVDIRVLGVERVGRRQADLRAQPPAAAARRREGRAVLRRGAGGRRQRRRRRAVGSGDRVPGVRGVRVRRRRPARGREDWMVTLHPAILPKFQVAQLVSRRSFVFARAGFGKSNLIKLLFSRLYATDPCCRPVAGRRPGSALSSSTRTASTSGPTRTAAPGCATCHRWPNGSLSSPDSERLARRTSRSSWTR